MSVSIHIIVVFDTDVENDYIPSIFLFFQNSTFSGFYMGGGLCKRAKNDTQLPISVSHTLHSITA